MQTSSLRGWVAPIVLALAVAVPAVAHAGELKFGAKPLDVDAAGKLTAAARADTVTSIESIPGDELWTVHLWAKIDGGAQGPLYIEFYRQHRGKRLMAYRFPYEEYAGEKYVTMDVDLSRSDGFRPDDKLEVVALQNIGGKDRKKASAKLTLVKSSQPAPKPEPEPEPEPEPDAEADGEPARDSRPATAAEVPPPIEPSKKGCHVDPGPGAPWLLMIAALGWRRRYRPG